MTGRVGGTHHKHRAQGQRSCLPILTERCPGGFGFSSLYQFLSSPPAPSCADKPSAPAAPRRAHPPRGTAFHLKPQLETGRPSSPALCQTAHLTPGALTANSYRSSWCLSQSLLPPGGVQPGRGVSAGTKAAVTRQKYRLGCPPSAPHRRRGVGEATPTRDPGPGSHGSPSTGTPG